MRWKRLRLSSTDRSWRAGRTPSSATSAIIHRSSKSVARRQWSRGKPSAGRRDADQDQGIDPLFVEAALPNGDAVLTLLDTPTRPVKAPAAELTQFSHNSSQLFKTTNHDNRYHRNRHHRNRHHRNQRHHNRRSSSMEAEAAEVEPRLDNSNRNHPRPNRRCTSRRHRGRQPSHLHRRMPDHSHRPVL